MFMLQSQNCGNKQDMRGASAIVQWVNKQAIETLEKAAIKVKMTQLENPKEIGHSTTFGCDSKFGLGWLRLGPCPCQPQTWAILVTVK